MYTVISVVSDIQVWEDFFQNTQSLCFFQKHHLIEPKPLNHI